MFLLSAFRRQDVAAPCMATCSSLLHQMGASFRPYASNVAYDDEFEEDRGRLVKFVSMERRRVPRPPYYRPPIYFPDVTLQMMKLEDNKMEEVKATGWTREVAFRTTPNVTKPEIKAILETMYGMEVERVNTINYLGRKHATFLPGSGKFPKRHLWREDDWKKAYVIFKPRAGDDQPSAEVDAGPAVEEEGEEEEEEEEEGSATEELVLSDGMNTQSLPKRSRVKKPVSMIHQLLRARGMEKKRRNQSVENKKGSKLKGSMSKH